MQAIIYWGRQHRQHFRFANIAQREGKNKNHTQQAPMLGARRVLFKLLKKEMVLPTTFALAQRHERREINGNNKMTSFLAGMSSYLA